MGQAMAVGGDPEPLHPSHGAPLRPRAVAQCATGIVVAEATPCPEPPRSSPDFRNFEGFPRGDFLVSVALLFESQAHNLWRGVGLCG
jgi:hypothetical protein